MLERPEYGYATYFFELVDSLSTDWQIKRLVTAMKLTNCGRITLIENKTLLVIPSICFSFMIGGVRLDKLLAVLVICTFVVLAMCVPAWNNLVHSNLFEKRQNQTNLLQLWNFPNQIGPGGSLLFIKFLGHSQF